MYRLAKFLVNKLNETKILGYKQGYALLDYVLYYLNNKQHGKQFIYYKNNSIQFEDNYLNGKLHGKQFIYYEFSKLENAKRNIVDSNKLKQIQYTFFFIAMNSHVLQSILMIDWRAEKDTLKVAYK